MLDNIATRLSRYPLLKRVMKFLYQVGSYILNFHLQKKNCLFPVERVSARMGGFFGYYDKSPESPDGKYLVYHALSNDDTRVTVVLKNISDGSEKIIAVTKAFNLQAGSRLHWLSNNSFIFNMYHELPDDYYSVIYDVTSGLQKKNVAALYDTHNQNYLSINFKNLAYCGSEYGYYAHKKTDNVIPVINAGNFKDDTIRPLVEYETVKRLVPAVSESANKVHFNHVMYNPAGTAFVFIVRWNGASGRQDALLHYALNTGVTKVINQEMTSHFCWMNDETLFGYMCHESRKGYYELFIPDRKFTLCDNKELAGDGHPTYKNGIVLTDTYPDKARMQHVMILNDHKALLVGRFFSPLTFNETNRCDLHPRFNTTGKKIYIDSKHEGTRHLYCIKFIQP